MVRLVLALIPCSMSNVVGSRRWRANPVRFFTETLQPAIDGARLALAEFVGADPDGLVFVPNATAGINSVLPIIGVRPRAG